MKTENPNLTAVATKNNYPRLVDTESFKGVDKRNLSMADVVATVLWKYNPDALEAFFDLEAFPKFRFWRKELKDTTRQDFLIERKRTELGIAVTVCRFTPDSYLNLLIEICSVVIYNNGQMKLCPMFRHGISATNTSS